MLTNRPQARATSTESPAVTTGDHRLPLTRATLLSYANIFELPRRYEVGGTLYPPTEACKAAAWALRFASATTEVSDHRSSADAGETGQRSCAGGQHET